MKLIKKLNFTFINTSTRQVLYKLHLLPIEKQIDFKILLLSFKCLNCLLAPSNLSDAVKRHVPQYNFRSTNSYQLLDVAYNLRNYSLRWLNALPLDIQSSSDLLSSNTNSRLNMFLGQLFNRLVNVRLLL